jgi:hypothetical protein
LNQAYVLGFLLEGWGEDRDFFVMLSPMASRYVGWSFIEMFPSTVVSEPPWRSCVKITKGKHLPLFFWFCFPAELLPVWKQQWGSPCLLLILTADEARGITDTGLIQSAWLLFSSERSQLSLKKLIRAKPWYSLVCSLDTLLPLD